MDMELESSIDLLNYVNKFVEVTTKFRTSRQGIVLTIDPETRTVILLDKDKPNKIYIINGDTIKLKTILDSSPSYEIKTAAYMATITDCQKPSLTRPSLIDHDAICMKLLNWLIKNKYEAVNENGILKISDNLIILSPYGIEQCISNDKTLLEDVKNCIRNIPL